MPLLGRAGFSAEEAAHFGLQACVSGRPLPF
jgi:hypothetical protein